MWLNGGEIYEHRFRLWSRTDDDDLLTFSGFSWKKLWFVHKENVFDSYKKVSFYYIMNKQSNFREKVIQTMMDNTKRKEKRKKHRLSCFCSGDTEYIYLQELILWSQDSMFIHGAPRGHRGDVMVPIERVQLDAKPQCVDGQQLWATVRDIRQEKVQDQVQVTELQLE